MRSLQQRPSVALSLLLLACLAGRDRADEIYTCSSSDCTTLDWYNNQGDSDVCATSCPSTNQDNCANVGSLISTYCASTSPTASPAVGLQSFATALSQCQGNGERLCTEAELANKEAHASGCNINPQFAWSQDT